MVSATGATINTVDYIVNKGEIIPANKANAIIIHLTNIFYLSNIGK
jgi:hypothetical protein